MAQKRLDGRESEIFFHQSGTQHDCKLILRQMQLEYNCVRKI